MEAGIGRIVSLNAPAASVFAADPRVAEVRPASPTSLFVLGVAPGRTTIVAIGDEGQVIAQFDVVIQPSSFAAAQAATAISKLLPGRGVRVETQPNGLVVSGTLRTAAEASDVLQVARRYLVAGQTIDSRITVLGGQQVNLRVRIAEASREVIRQLGINWSSLANLGKYAAIGVVTRNPLAVTTLPASSLAASYAFPTMGHQLDINGVIDAMARDQLVHVLAEPNLTAISGESASFLVGGEFPIPVAQQNNQVTVEFKQYGVSLAFVPTVEGDDRINMKVRTEVSALTSAGAVQLGVGNSSIQVPALTVRRAETTVELSSGQSFAIAGLLQDSTTTTGNALPGIGEIPILGALFRSDGFQRNQTELVIVITPYLVLGASGPAQVRLPTDGWKPPNDLERVLLLRQSARAVTPQGEAPKGLQRVPGDAGFVVR
jgi:pilus assembly protein CpaC